MTTETKLFCVAAPDSYSSAPGSWVTFEIARETAKSVYRQRGGWANSQQRISTDDVKGRFATLAEAEAFKVASVAAWDAGNAGVWDAEAALRAAVEKANAARREALAPFERALSDAKSARWAAVRAVAGAEQ